MRAAQNSDRWPQPGQAPAGEYDFLVGRLLDGATLVRAEAEARAAGVTVHRWLMARGWASEQEYVARLAAEFGLPVVLGGGLRALEPPARPQSGLRVVRAALEGLGVVKVVEATASTPRELAALLARLSSDGAPIALAGAGPFDEIELSLRRPRLIQEAVSGLWRRQPDMSARGTMALWQRLALAMLAGLMVGSFGVAPDLALAGFTALLSIPFLCVVALRTVAIAELLRRPEWAPLASSLNATTVGGPPLYTLLVPLHLESHVLPGLAAALSALDYPAERLEILLVLEAVDHETRAAAEALDLPGNFRIVIVPNRGPRTKPKALNYALGLARGTYIAVYDAEDVPEPDQLRRALALFAAAGPRLACVQARLNIYNPGASLLTRQFALEYSALFDALLPALERLGVPLPLGGTSNHFRADILREVGAWDPYNVTEDADLGFRLARQGYATATLPSTTWEEAPQDLGNWLRQRTRWLKGWTQTYLVHTRSPVRLARELGAWRALAFHGLMGGVLVSVIVHPLIYALMAAGAWTGALFVPPEDGPGRWIWWIAGANLALGYLSSMILGALAALRRGRPGLALHALLMPFYWLLVSLAGYRALAHLARRPFQWEKTEHGRRAGALPGMSAQLALEQERRTR